MNLRRLPAPAAQAAAGVLLVTACGTGAGPPDGDPQDGATAGPVAPSAVADPELVLPWIPIGPTGPGEPLWYDPIRTLDCSDDDLVASRSEPVPLAGYLLCHALERDDPQLWSRGVEALESGGEPQNCWERAADAGLRRLVEFHRAHPGADPVLEPPEGTACPLVLEALETPVSADDPGAPVSVPSCGGAPVFLDGNIVRLPEGTVRSVSVGAVDVPVHSGNGGLFFRAPASAEAGPVSVTVAESDHPVEGKLELLYTRPPGGCPAPPPTVPDPGRAS
ncbi:hypothetical protein ACH9EU_10170 [Kocuria sp. M1R5S2]|uniref:hypothetical protein n=1 Tax=Kocuria rhizosphaerae TaxID=3376285 RepID=UPI0037A9D921